ncbi:MAG: hypothetical protein L6R00_02010 [Phycisphaerae bacterium]|nr:hypothetical protein [Phycisphaerae bacterium]
MAPPARCPRRVVSVVVTLFVTLLIASQVLARPTIRTAFFAEYPVAVGSALDSVPSHPLHCGVCHYNFNGGGTRNPYGERLSQVIGNYPNTQAGRQQAIRSIQNEDNDGDSYTSLAEITDLAGYSNTPTFPGLTPANVGNVSNVNPAELMAYLVPTVGSDTTPPAVTVLSPNGGESWTGNAAATIEWTATDAGGVAAVHLFLSDDNGQIYRPLALGLSNTGSHQVFVPNRPTSQARVLVVAVDNAGNPGQDAGDNAFSVVAPSGGIVPSTLRDFDLPGTQPHDATSLADPNDCATCHGGYDAAVEPFRNWQGSMMAHASRDPLFEACMAIANQDAPDSGDLCLRCHLPAGWLAGRSVPTSGSQMLPSDRMGVACDLCHRMVDPVPDTANPAEDTGILAALAAAPTDFGNGMFVVDPTGTRRGPFSDATLGHPILVSPFHREAALCGTCHDVSNPAFERDANGNYPPAPLDAPATDTSAHSLMPIERTYSEWFHSAYNSPGGVFAPQFGGNRTHVAVCQDCHMRAVTGAGCNDPAAPIRTLLPLHDMTGGSTWLAGLLPALYPSEVNSDAIAAGIVRARYMLTNAASLTAVQNGATLLVTVVNETGHKLPTGYPEGRRIWLHVQFFDDAPSLIEESGAYVSATGELVHDEQIKVYEAKPGLDSDTAGLVGVSPGPSFHFVLNNRIYKDNRIPPRGFTNASYEQFGGAPVGHTYADSHFWDDTPYEIPPGATQVQINLYYQSTSREYVEFLRDENVTNTKGQELYDLWSNNGRCPPELMASIALPLTPVPVPGDIDGDGDVGETDRTLLVAVLLGLDIDPQHVARADMNGDGAADGEDVGAFLEALFES